MKNTSVKSYNPRMLFASRHVKNTYAEVVHNNPLGTKITSSLDYQMTESLKDLMKELRDEGRDYELYLEKHPKDILRRWNIYANGEKLAELDEDFGYDCFDISTTCFKETVTQLINNSNIQPLSQLERNELNAQVKAKKIIEHMYF